MFRFLRPKLKVSGGAVYGLGPIPDAWGAARLIFEKQFTYPLDARFGAGIPVSRPYRLTQPAPALAIQGVFISGIVGIPVGSYYATPASTVANPGNYGG